MVRIAICDNENKYAHKLETAINYCLTKKKNLFEVTVYCSGNEFLNEKTRVFYYDVIFLDIDVDGIEIAKEIRNFSDKVFIVFSSSYAEHILDGYKYNIIRYILKDDPDFQGIVDDCMVAIIKKIYSQNLRKTFRFIEGERRIQLEKLLYIESRLHKLDFHVVEENEKIYTMNGKMNDLEVEMNGYGFIRMHQSFLVNAKCIKEVKRYKAVLVNNHEIFIPKTRYMNVKNEFNKYLEKNNII